MFAALLEILGGGGGADNKIEYSAKENILTLATIASDCDDFLDFFQAVTEKLPRIIYAVLFLCTYKNERIWFC